MQDHLFQQEEDQGKVCLNRILFFDSRRYQDEKPRASATASCLPPQ